MKKKLLALCAITLMVGCSTSQVSTAYKTETAVDTSVTTAWSLWQAYLQANPSTSQATQVQVTSAFNKVKATELIAIDATAAIASSTNTNSVSIALTAESVVASAFSDLGNLLAQFNIKL